MNEHKRNVVVQMAVEALRTGKLPEGNDPELLEAVKGEVAFLKRVRDQVGEKEFSKMTIDVGYDYD